MPVVIVVLPEALPAILVEATDDALLARIASLRGAPTFEAPDKARAWLATLPLPSGWFASEADAGAFVSQCKTPQAMTPKELAAIRSATGLSRDAFAKAIGYAGNSNTRHKQIFDMENGKKAIMPDKALRVRALAALDAGRGLDGNGDLRTAPLYGSARVLKGSAKSAFHSALERFAAALDAASNQGNALHKKRRTKNRLGLAKPGSDVPEAGVPEPAAGDEARPRLEPVTKEA
jgi:hypothetical protein